MKTIINNNCDSTLRMREPNFTDLHNNSFFFFFYSKADLID